MAHKTPSTSPVRSSLLWLRRGAPLAVLCLGLGAALAAGAHTPGEVSAPVASANAVAAHSVSSSCAKADESPLREAQAVAAGYEKSDVSDVMVRHVPASSQTAKTKARPAAGRVYLRNGATKLTPALRDGYGEPPTTNFSKVVLPNGGGISRRIPSSYYPASHIKKANGHIVQECVDPLHHHKSGAASRKLAR